MYSSGTYILFFSFISCSWSRAVLKAAEAGLRSAAPASLFFPLMLKNNQMNIDHTAKMHLFVSQEGKLKVVELQACFSCLCIYISYSINHSVLQQTVLKRRFHSGFSF